MPASRAAKFLRTRRPLLALVGLLALAAIGYAVQAASGDHGSAGHGTQVSRSASVPASSLPTQAQQTIVLIKAGGPFPYPEDGEVFRNDQGLLPIEPHGYYREFTVPTPGASDRGARRIIHGRHGEFFYTADHYASFVRVDPNR